MSYFEGSTGRRSCAGLLIVTLGLGLSVAVFAGRDSDSATKALQGSVPGRYDAALALQRQFELFRSPSEELPVDIRRILKRPRHGTDWSLAQRLFTQVWPIWVVPGPTTVCLLDQERSNSAVGEVCSSVPETLGKGLLTSSLRELKGGPAERVVIGIAPDYVHKVAVETGGFPDVVVPVSGNVYALEDQVPEPPERARLIYKRASGDPRQ